MEQLKKPVRRCVPGRRITDQFYVDGEVTVPDAKFGIGRVICSRGKLKLEDMKPAENYIRVTGRVLYQILYVSAEDGRRMASLQGKLPFEEMVYAEEPARGNCVLREGNAELAVSVIHPGKVSVRAAVEMELESWEETEDVLTLDVEEEPGLCRKWETREILKLKATFKDSLRIKEECRLPGSKGAVGQILFTDVSLRKFDTRLGADELQLRGELTVFVLYESAQGTADWIGQTVPFEGKLACYGAEDAMYASVFPELTDETVEARMDEDGEMRIFNVEGSLTVRGAVYCEEELKILTDLYSLQKTLTPETEEIPVAGLVMQKTARYRLTEQVTIPEPAGAILQICHTGGRTELTHTELAADGILAEGILHLRVLYVKADDREPFAAWRRTVPFTYTIPAEGMEPGLEYELCVMLTQLGISLLGEGEAELKAAMDFRVLLRRPGKVVNIREIREEPCDREALLKEPGIVGYLVKEGDELWALAKRYHTTGDNIRVVNGLEGEGLKTGQKLLITACVCEPGQ